VSDQGRESDVCPLNVCNLDVVNLDGESSIVCPVMVDTLQ
jgi:hypothetical protein